MNETDLERVNECVEYVQKALFALANPEKAGPMQAYMKTDMPFYGVQKQEREPIVRELLSAYPPADDEEYRAMVLALWHLPHREEKYLALAVARGHRGFIMPESLPLYRRLIVEGAWWDLVDEVATHLIRDLVVSNPGATWQAVDPWVDDDDMWLRRAAIICQVGAKAHTDESRLFDFCSRRAHEEEFFIRKAIGWALRDYARTNPSAVAEFVAANEGRLSGLSKREATRHLS
jgi:3-methyladenine DNA glycosylase AlkD